MENLFAYSSTDYTANPLSWEAVHNKDQLSKFDAMIHDAWKRGMKDGLFRYTLDGMKSRVVPGPRRYVLQLNLKRGKLRRKPENFDSLNQPFDARKFNFNKVPQEEVVCILRPVDHPEGDESCQHLVVLNVSPLEFGHILLIPDSEKNIPQKLTERGVQLSIEMVLLSSHPGFRVGFNSLCALASVNHQHLHAWYLGKPMPLEDEPVHFIATGLYETSKFPAKALVFQLQGSTVSQLTKRVAVATDYLQRKEIAHNVLVIRGSSFEDPHASTVRIYLWMRKSVQGAKNEAEGEIVFNVAVAELLGQIPMFAPALFGTLTEDEITDRILAEMLSEEVYEEHKRGINQLLTEIK